MFPGEAVGITTVATADINDPAALIEGKGSGKKIEKAGRAFADRGRRVSIPETVVKAVPPEMEVERGQAVVVVAYVFGSGSGRRLEHALGVVTRRSVREEGLSG